MLAKHWLVTAAKRESSNVADGLVPLGHEDRLADRAVGDPVDVWLRKAHPSWLRPRRQRRTGMQPHEAGKVRRKECILTHVRIATLATHKIVGCRARPARHLQPYLRTAAQVAWCACAGPCRWCRCGRTRHRPRTTRVHHRSSGARMTHNSPTVRRRTSRSIHSSSSIISSRQCSDSSSDSEARAPQHHILSAPHTVKVDHIPSTGD